MDEFVENHRLAEAARKFVTEDPEKRAQLDTLINDDVNHILNFHSAHRGIPAIYHYLRRFEYSKEVAVSLAWGEPFRRNKKQCWRLYYSAVKQSNTSALLSISDSERIPPHHWNLTQVLSVWNPLGGGEEIPKGRPEIKVMHSKHNRAPFMRYIRNERTSSLIICDGRDLSVRHERRDEDDGPLAFQFYLRGRQTNTVVAFSIHHDGLIACPESTNLHIWNLNDEKLVMGDSLSPKFYLAENLGLLSAIEATTFLDANTVCIATASSILLWDLRTNGVASRVQYIPKRGSKVVCMDSTNASHWKRCSLLTGDTNGTICQWDLRKSAVAHTFQQPTEVTTLQYSPDGKHFISGGKDGVVGLWKSIEQQPIMIHDMHGELPIVDAAWKDDSVIASLSADSATSRSIITIWRPTIFMLPPE